MPNTTVTPNMGLIIPTVGVDPTPDYPTNINNDLITIDGHTHELGSGVQITPLAININGDLAFNSNNLNVVRSMRMVNNASTLSAAGDIANTYVVNGNLYFNNASGVPVQITNGTVVNATVTSNYNFTITSASSNFSISASATYAIVSVNATGGAYTITLPSAAAVSSGRMFLIKDTKGYAATHNITVAPNGTDTIDGQASLVMGADYQAVFVYSDASGNWLTVNSGDGYYVSEVAGGITSAVAGGITSGVTGGISLTGGSSDWITFSARTRTLHIPIDPIVINGSIWKMTTTYPPALTTSGTPDGLTALLRLPKLHQGATLASVQVGFSVSFHSGVPATLPSIDIRRYNATLGVNASDQSLSSSGAQSPSTPASGSAWFDSGNAQTWTFTCNQNNVIDQSSYCYYAVLINEHGTNSAAGNTYWELILSYTSITSDQFQ